MASDRPRTLWDPILNAVLKHRLPIAVLVLLLVGAGVSVAPFSVDLPIPRSPVPVDAIPDLGDNQQLVYTEWSGRSPRDVEDQITYPLTTALLGIPGVRTVRSSSALGFSSIAVIFDDEVEFYWSRSRVLEKLASLPPGTVPDGVRPMLGPDATALGQVYWYTLEGRDPETGELVGGWDPDELRSVQDWTVRYALQAASGVSEVASVGGYVREVQVDVDPDALQAYGVSIEEVADAVRRSNLDVGARTLEINGVEYLVRGVGFVESLEDVEKSVIVARDGTPIRIRDVGRVTEGPALRRGALDDAGAPAVGGVVVARYRSNPFQVIDAVKAQIASIQPGLPVRRLEDGRQSRVTIVPFYDRSDLIGETLSTLSTALYRQILVTIIVVLVMMRNLRSSLLVSSMVPLGVLGTFVVMKATGVDANIMALGGIAIAIGTMVDVGIVFVENIERRLHSTSTARLATIRSAAAEVAPAVLTSVLTTVVSFLPVFGLTETELRLFAPLALTKTFAMVVAFALAVLVLPGLVLVAERPGPKATRASPLQVRYLRDWLLGGLGIAALWVSVPGGLLVVALAGWRLVRDRLAERVRTAGDRTEQVVVVGAVSVLLVVDWMPLGHSHGYALNLLFTGLLLVTVLGTFTLFTWSYPRLLATALAHKRSFLTLPTGMVAFGLASWIGVGPILHALPKAVQTSAPISALAHTFPGLGREYMPSFDEGSFLYMPTTMPHASIGEAQQMLSALDASIAQIPEVNRVVGKIGRVESALDPAPVSMIETLVTIHPEYRTEPDGRRVRQWRDHIQSTDDIWTELTRAGNLPGLTSAPVLMPIGARLVMLQSGLRAPMGIKVRGPDLDTIEQFGLALEPLLQTTPGVRSASVFAQRVVGKPYLELALDRSALGRFGLRVVDVQSVLDLALGGRTLTRTVEGRERSSIRVRYAREDRDSIEALERLSISVPGGGAVPLSQLAQLSYVKGPQVIQSEDTFLTGNVLFDATPGTAEVDVVQAAGERIEDALASGSLTLPEGVSYTFAGTYESQLRSEGRLKVLVPVAIALIFVLLTIQFRRVSTTLIVSSGVIVATSGAFSLLWLYGQPGFLALVPLGIDLQSLFQVGPVHLSLAVWVGIIALIGIATDDGVVMATWLHQDLARAPVHTVPEVRRRVLDAGLRRVRPCLMTTATTLLALLPVVTSHGRGSDIMVPMALPLVGGMAVSVVTLFVVPVLFSAVEEHRLRTPSSST
ncbi:MAG TPA: acriflavine resistance protein B [Deltaproteobacteria bacterium]|nr:acriflavine resistance protein B [Deltaproteobacteria bacterium]